MKKSFVNNKYNTSIVFKKEMIAPCGMNCGACLGFMRFKNHCPGCRSIDTSKPGYCHQCMIINCDLLKRTESKFCYDCPKYPCQRLKSLDKRYRTKYNTGFFDNLAMIEEKGMDAFLLFETERRTCPRCGSILCIHRTFCFECGLTHQSKSES